MEPKWFAIFSIVAGTWLSPPNHAVPLEPIWEVFRSPSGTTEPRLMSRGNSPDREEWAVIDVPASRERYRIRADISRQFAWVSDDGRSVVIADHHLPGPIDLDQPVLSFYVGGTRVRSYSLSDLGLTSACVNPDYASSWLSGRRDGPWGKASIHRDTLTLPIQDLSDHAFDVATGRLLDVRSKVTKANGDEFFQGVIRLVTPEIEGVTSRTYAIRPRCAISARGEHPDEIAFTLAEGVAAGSSLAKRLRAIVLPNVETNGSVRLVNGEMVDGWMNVDVACGCGRLQWWTRR